jgi:hypothetical protein
MSDATDAILEAQADALTQHGVAFTVDGDAVAKTCVASDVIWGNILTEHGMEQRQQCSIHFLATAWTPVIGKRVTVRSKTFVVDAIQRDHDSYSLTLVESHT